MPVSLAEETADIYYRKKGYVVEANIYYLEKRKSAKQRANLEIDRLAIKPKAEALIISCKRGRLNQQDREKEVELFKLHENFLTNHDPWRLLLKDCVTKRVYIAEYVSEDDKTFLESHGVEVIGLKELLEKLVESLKQEMTETGKSLVGAETKAVPRLLKFMIEKKMLGEKK